MKISIITATYNSERTVQAAIDSIKSQDYQSIEYIVVDGASKDRTMEIVQSNSDVICKVVSEPDKGIYDALNKGISLASGEVVGILHSDDFFATQTVITDVAEGFQDEEVDAVYGDLDYVDRERPEIIIRKWRSRVYTQNLFYNGWMPAHPTFFLRREHFLQHGSYDLSFFLGADYELMLRMMLRFKVQAKYIPKTLVKMRVGGQSNVSWKNRWIANQEDARAWKVNGLKPRFYTRWMKPLSKLAQFVS